MFLYSITSPFRLPAALSSRHSLQTLGVSWRKRRTQLPHPSPSPFIWDEPQQQPDVGAPGATQYPQTLEPELPPPCSSTPTLSCSLLQGGAVHWRIYKCVVKSRNIYTSLGPFVLHLSVFLFVGYE